MKIVRLGLQCLPQITARGVGVRAWGSKSPSIIPHRFHPGRTGCAKGECAVEVGPRSRLASADVREAFSPRHGQPARRRGCVQLLKNCVADRVKVCAAYVLG